VSLVAHGLLGLLERQPRHGYELRQEYDTHFSGARPLKSGQIYSTISRLERDGQVAPVGEEPGRGPERKMYAISRRGVAELERWLLEPEPAAPYLQNVLFMKVVLAVSSGRNAQRLLDAQREHHHREMRRITRAKHGDLLSTVRADFALFHLEADVHWIDMTLARLERLGEELKP
jgi:DNA-binding PadR family transcriptional regulator